MQESKQEKSPIKQRILLFLKEKGISMYDCYAKTGITRGILAQNNGISEDNIMRFLAYYIEVNTDWLILGRGSMLRNSKNPEETKLGCTPNATPISPAEESVIYKMYKDKDEESRTLIRENGRLEERLRSMEQELGALKSHSQFQNKESDHQSRISEAMEAFTLESSGISGEDFLPTKPPTSKRLSAGKM